jgi:hypothetical protein
MFGVNLPKAFVPKLYFWPNKCHTMFFGNPNYYYFVMGLQALCVIHCLRKGREAGWIWFIVFVPIIGSIAYIAVEIINRRNLQDVGAGIGSVIASPGKVKKLEKQLHFSDTFNNRVALADAYLAAGQKQPAIDMYESSLTGAFTENEYVLKQLILAYFEAGQYDRVIPIAKKLYSLPAFARSKAHVLYAMSLEKTGNNEQAEKEYQQMKGRFSNFEARYQYGMFLQRTGRNTEAGKIFKDMTEEATQLTSMERRAGREWFALAKEELRK